MVIITKNIFMIFLCLVLVLLTSCGESNVDYVPETSSEEVSFEHLITESDLRQLYIDNKEVFNNVIIELKKLPEDVYAISFEDKEIIFNSGTGKIITEKFNCDYDRVIDCFETLYSLADEKLEAEYVITITKEDYGISFNIRSLYLLVDYDIKYVEITNETHRYTNIEGPWYLSIFGLV